MQALKKQSLAKDGLEFVRDEPEPRVGHSDVKIRVEAASICGTDQSIYHIIDRPGMRDEMLVYNGGDVSRYQPIIIGHEFCGEVAEVGEDVDKGLCRPGDYVTAEMHISCGYCQQCRTGQRHICRNIRVKGVHLDGAFAEYVVLPSDNVINWNALWTQSDPASIAFPRCAWQQRPHGNGRDGPERPWRFSDAARKG